MMRRNIAELPEFVRKAKELGCDAVSTGFLIVYSEDMRGESLYYDKPLANRYLEEARTIAREIGIEFHDMGQFDLEWNQRKQSDSALSDSQGRYRSCRELWEFAYINCIGEVFPCCWHQTPLGNLRKNTFEEIWNNSKYRAYRRGIQRSEPSPHCRHCMLPYLRGCNDIENHIRIFSEDGFLLDTEKATTGST